MRLCLLVLLLGCLVCCAAAPISLTGKQIASKPEAFDAYPIRFFYSICGTGDSIAYASASKAAKDLPKYSDRFTEANWLWQECPGKHDFAIWYLGLFNFLRILGN